MVELNPKFYAPTPGQVDLSPMMEGARSTAAAYMAIGEAVGKGIESQAREQQRKQEEKAVTELLGGIDDAGNFDNVSYTLAEDKFPDIVANYAGDPLVQKIKIAERLAQEGYSTTEAESIAAMSLQQNTARVLNPIGRAKIGRMRAMLLAKGVDPKVVESTLNSTSAFATYDEFTQNKRAAGVAMLKPAESTDRLKMELELQRARGVIAAQVESEKALSDYKAILGKDMATFEADLKQRTVPQLEAEIAKIRSAYSTQEALRDYALRDRLMKREAAITKERDTRLYGYDTEKQKREFGQQERMLDLEIKGKGALIDRQMGWEERAAEAKSMAGEKMSAPEENAVFRLGEALDRDEPAAPDIALLDLMGGNAIDASNELNAFMGREIGGYDMAALSSIRLRATVNSNGQPDFEVYQPSVTMMGGDEVAKAVEKLIIKNFSSRRVAGKVIAASQLSGITNMGNSSLWGVVGTRNPALRSMLQESFFRVTGERTDPNKSRTPVAGEGGGVGLGTEQMK